MSRTFQFVSKYENPSEVMDLAQRIHSDETFPCDECQQLFPDSELTVIEYRNHDRSVCSLCIANMPEEFPIDEDHGRDR